MKWPSWRGGINWVLRKGKKDKPIAITNKDEKIINLDFLSIPSKVVSYLFFKNLTMAPIEKDLINFDLLNVSEKNYLFKYHLEVYSKISKYLTTNEKKWLACLI